MAARACAHPMRSDEEVARRNVENHLYEALNATDSPDFFLALREFNLVQGGQPAARRIKAFLERELKNYDPDGIRAEFGERVFDEGPVLRIGVEDTSFRRPTRGQLATASVLHTLVVPLLVASLALIPLIGLTMTWVWFGARDGRPPS
jgi:hypothetical protein